VLVALVAGCAKTTVTYPGPRRPAREVAVLENSETSLDVIDDRAYRDMLNSGMRYEVLPGRRMLGVSLFIKSVIPGGDADIERSPNTIFFCIDALPGHKYFVTHVGRGAAWRPEVLDAATYLPVPFAPCSET
jgi:hypothetical protein